MVLRFSVSNLLSFADDNVLVSVGNW